MFNWIKRLFHRHDWTVVGTSYCEPIPYRSPFRPSIFMGDWIMQKLTWGFTTTLYRCPECKKTKQEEMLGKRQ